MFVVTFLLLLLLLLVLLLLLLLHFPMSSLPTLQQLPSLLPLF
jgi:hypothetical protein